MNGDIGVRQADPDADMDGLVDVLVDCVSGGASVGFMLPFSRERAADFWAGIFRGAARGERVVLVAEDVGGVVGTVQVVLAAPENQPHRGEISKMLVHRRARRRGVGGSLMRAAESVAIEAGKSLLVLDTASPDAERLYGRLGWQRVGAIPGYALWPEGGLADTIIFCKTLG
jgi:GNAT superfamily N-acetyltransferase